MYVYVAGANEGVQGGSFYFVPFIVTSSNVICTFMWHRPMKVYKVDHFTLCPSLFTSSNVRCMFMWHRPMKVYKVDHFTLCLLWWWCGGGVDPILCVSTHRISDPRSGPAQLLPPHVKQRSYPHGVRPQIPDR